jgi:hypothetical protein
VQIILTNQVGVQPWAFSGQLPGDGLTADR